MQICHCSHTQPHPNHNSFFEMNSTTETTAKKKANKMYTIGCGSSQSAALLDLDLIIHIFIFSYSPCAMGKIDCSICTSLQYKFNVRFGERQQQQQQPRARETFYGWKETFLRVLGVVRARVPFYLLHFFSSIIMQYALYVDIVLLCLFDHMKVR